MTGVQTCALPISTTAASVVGGVITGTSTSVSGNITASFFLGNGSQLTGIAGGGGGSSITNGTSNVSVAASGNVTVGVAGTAAVTTFATTGIFVPGLASITGNVTGGNITTAGLISATGAITGASVVGGVITGSSASVTGTTTAASVVGGVITGSSTSVTGNVTGGNLSTGGVITGTLKGVKVTLSDLGTLTTGTTTIDLATAQVFTATITAANTITIAFSNAPAAGQSQVVLLRLTNAGSGTIVWPASTKFTGGTAPTLTASGVDVLGVYYDVTSTTYMVFVIGLNVKVP